MEILGHFYMLLVYIPGLAELLILCMTFAIVKYPLKVPWPKASTLSIVIVSIIGFGFWFAFNILNDYRAFLKPVIYLVTGASSFYLLKKGTPELQKFSFPVIAGIFGLLEWQLSFVQRDVKVVSTKWEIGGVPFGLDDKSPNSVNLYYSKCSFAGLESIDLVEHLNSKVGQKVEIILRPVYHYGSQAGYSLGTIDGKLFSSERGWSGSSCDDKSSPMPKFHVGLRGFGFN